MANTEQWGLGTVEYGSYVGKKGKNILVHMGKVLPLVKLAKPKTKKVSLNKSCIINASKCKPTISSQVIVANYLTLPLKANTSLSGKFKDKLRIEVVNHSVDQLTVDSKVSKTKAKR